MERKFLMYILYTTFLEIRERAYEMKDDKIFWLCDLMHNIPLYLETENEIKETYNRLNEDVEALGIQQWMSNRKEEFYLRHPEFKP